MDDPAFAIDAALPALAFDFDFDLENGGHSGSERTSQSMLSIRNRSGSVSSFHAPSVLGLNISSSSNGGGYQMQRDPFGNSSAQKPFGAGGGIFDNNNDEEMMMIEDNLFDFDADGNMRDIPANERDARQAAKSYPQSRLGSDSVASGCVRKEQESTFTSGALQIVDGDGDFNMFGDDYDLPMAPDTEALPILNGSFSSSRPDPNASNQALSDPEAESSSVSAEARQKRKRSKKIKTMKIDQGCELKNIDLSAWQKNYIEIQHAARIVKANHKAVPQAKKNAFHFVFGSGINGIGESLGTTKFESPLAMFSGAPLLATLTGTTLPSKSKRGTKRARGDQDDTQELSTPSKRQALELEDEVGRGYEDDGFMPQMDDHEQSMEVGRDAAIALADYPSSAMPWNQSASLLSHQRGASLSLPGRMGSVVGRRLTSASPLVGRGSALPGDLDNFDDVIKGYDEDMVMYGREDSALPLSSQGFAVPAGTQSSSQNEAIESEEFEFYGAAANVDSQTAGTSQWLRTVLDKESNNFLEYVKNSIDEKKGDELSGGDELDNKGRVTFEELFDPKKYSHVVAAQAFYHVLSLATKHLVWVDQVVNEDFEPFDEISIGVV